MARWQRWGAILVPLALTLAACTGEPSPSEPIATPSPSAATPSPTPEPPTPSPTPAPPSAVSWEASVGLIDVGAFPGGSVWGLLGFDAGYVAWGTYGIDSETDAFAIWNSGDGTDWDRTLLADQVAPCAGWTPRSNLEGFYAGATDGSQAILIGSVLDSPTREACDAVQPITLSTIDGVTWRRSEPSRTGGADQVWRTADGWRSASTSTGRIWASADGLSWQRAGSIRPGPDGLVRMAGDANDTLLAARNDQLLTSTNGSTWDPVATLPPGFAALSIAAPTEANANWVVAINDFEGGEGRLLSSQDLRTWHSTPLPNPETAWIVPWRDGWLAYTFWAGRVVGCNPCPSPPPPVMSWSADGELWTELAQPTDRLPPFVDTIKPADGPAGLLVVGPNTSDGVQVARITID
jgi:hypothetical protein